jgi:hypothetical protein
MRCSPDRRSNFLKSVLKAVADTSTSHTCQKIQHLEEILTLLHDFCLHHVRSLASYVHGKLQPRFHVVLFDESNSITFWRHHHGPQRNMHYHLITLITLNFLFCTLNTFTDLHSIVLCSYDLESRVNGPVDNLTQRSR